MQAAERLASHREAAFIHNACLQAHKKKEGARRNCAAGPFLKYVSRL